MAFLWGSSTAQTEFDTLLEKTTSDLLPSSTPVDLSLSLQLADLIRSNSIPPSQSCKSLLKRLQHPNPNVQLLSLQVLDVCIKNGGEAFLLQISDKDSSFVQQLEDFATNNKNKKESINRDVKTKVLEKLQEWSLAFKQGKPELRETRLVKLYDRLKLDPSIEFPTKIDLVATAAMVDSLSAPEWKDSSYCQRCRTDFSTFNRKHHCRNCGQVFDQACSSQSDTLPHYGITQPVRVCDTCHKMIKQGKGAQVARTSSSSDSKGGKATSGSSKTSRKEQEDEDLRRAIQASLNDSTSTHSHGPLRESQSSSSGYNPSYASNFSGGDSKQKKSQGGDQEDLDLAAAIAASLKDVQPPPTAPPGLNRQDTSSSQPVTYSEMFPPSSSSRPSYNSYDSTSTVPTQQPNRLHLPSYDLSPTSLSRLEQFQQTFNNPTHPHPGPTYLTSFEHELANESVRELKPQLEKSLRDTRNKGTILKELEWKLSEAARIYGAGLTELNHHHYYSNGYQVSHHHHQAQQQQYTTPLPPPQRNSNNPQYQYQPSSSSALVSGGQPLPNYAVPQPQPQYQPQAEYSHHHHQTQQEQQEQRQIEPQVEPVIKGPPKIAGYYKPSSFPNVPSTNPVTLPHVPEQEPWKHDEEEEQVVVSNKEEEKIGELIEF
ncbi:hypothetical protein JCM5350_003275 [Sporobolomyces pararoseus]